MGPPVLYYLNNGANGSKDARQLAVWTAGAGKATRAAYLAARRQN